LVVAAGLTGIYWWLRPSVTPSINVALTTRTQDTLVFPGFRNFMIIPPDGSLWRWGHFGPPGQQHAVQPERIGGEHTWVQADSSYRHWIGIQADGTLWEWGTRDKIELGSEPVQIGADDDWSRVSIGDDHGIALKSDGSAWSFGGNRYWQLGVGAGPGTRTPIPVAKGMHWIDIKASGNTSYGIRNDGTLWVWGRIFWNDPVAGHQLELVKPTQFSSDTNWTRFLPRKMFTVQNDNHELWQPIGKPDPTRPAASGSRRLFPSDTPLNPAFGYVVAPAEGIAIFDTRPDGTLWMAPTTWTTDQAVRSSKWRQVGERQDWVRLWSNWDTTIGLTSDGTLWTWGNDLSKEAGKDFRARTRQLKDGLGELLGNRPAAFNPGNPDPPPIQEEPRRLMEFNTP